MKTINLGPLGIFSIAFFIKHWNRTSDKTGIKHDIRAGLLSNNAVRVQLALADMTKIADPQIDQNELLLSEPLITSRSVTCQVLRCLGCSRQERQELMNASSAEIAFYFSEMFKAGHFEKLPMPEFGYEIPETKAFRSCSPEKLMQGAETLTDKTKLPETEPRFRGKNSGSSEIAGDVSAYGSMT